MKKIISLVLALCMMLMVGAAFATDGETGVPDTTGSTTDTAPAASTLPKANISITNLEDGDTVNLYKIIKWDTTASDWVFDGITVAGYTTVNALVTALNGNDAPAAMTALAAAVAEKTVENTKTLSGTTTYTYEAEVGSYLALVSTSSANVYNPMVLSVDFDRTTNPARASSTELSALSVTGTTIVAKKQPVTLDKDVDNTTDKKSDIAAGDTIPFVVTVTTPNYGTNYTDPYFVVSDTLSTGLEMSAEQQAAISVKVGDTDLVKGAEGDYTIVPSATGYVITFTKAYLNRVKSNTIVTIKYAATVTKNANWHQVDEFENEVTAEFSNKPTGEHGRLTDDTHHYTFSIDASLFGDESGRDITKELKKISMDSNGNVITAWTTTEENSWTSHTALEHAKFELRQGNTVVRSAESGADGRLTFTGLDAGEYTLYETSAPTGYKYNPAGIPVKITANYNTDGLLIDYTIMINNAHSSTYSVTLDGDHISTVTYKEGTTPTTSGIINTPGTTLPSTGGIGTTIFYVLGGLLVVGAAVILVARRKADN